MNDDVQRDHIDETVAAIIDSVGDHRGSALAVPSGLEPTLGAATPIQARKATGSGEDRSGPEASGATPYQAIRRAKLLRPRIGANVVARPRLCDRLTAALDHPLILVIGPAGYGKTTLLCEWLTTTSLPWAWLSLDEDDEDLAVFVAHVIAALQTAIPGIGMETLTLLNLPHPPSATVLGATLCDELLTLDSNVILVLDDYHEIDQPAIHDFVATLLRHPAPALQLVLSARGDPPLPLPGYRVRGQMAEIRATDLRFTDDEARAFLTGAVNATLDDATVTILQERTEGWIAGLRLAALALRRETGAGDLTRDIELHGRQHIIDFLVEEVLASQPAPVQTFLLRTSIVDRVSPALADALLDSPLGLGGAQTLLDGLARANLFVVPLGEDETWFRYHHLFRELLRHRLWLEVGEAGVAALHDRASAWYDQQGEIGDAIRHALTAGDPARAGQIIERHLERAIESESYQALGRWLTLLPEDLISSRPGLLIARAWSMHRQALSSAMRRPLSAAQSLLDGESVELDPATLRTLRGQIAVLSNFAYTPVDEPAQVIAWARSALDLLPRQAGVARGMAMLALAQGLLLNGEAERATAETTAFIAQCGPGDTASHARALAGLAFVHHLSADLPATERVGHALLALGTEHRQPYALQWARTLLGLVSYARNDLDQAITHFEAVVGDRQPVTFWIQRDAIMGLSFAYQARGRQLDADMLAARLMETVVATGNVENMAIVQAFRAELALRQGEHQSVLRWLESSSPSFDGDSPNCLTVPALLRVQALVASGRDADLAQAIHEGSAALEYFRRVRYRLCEIKTLLLLAAAYWARGDRGEAFDVLSRAIAFSEPGGLIRPFVDLGRCIAEPVRVLAQRSPESPYLRALVTGFEEVSPGEPIPSRLSGDASAHHNGYRRDSPEYLSEREMEVLERLSHRLSNKEIADELFISPLTVKRHASNIYNKLGVESRRQAIRRATELGLLSQQ